MLLKLSVLLLWNQVARKFRKFPVYSIETQKEKDSLWKQVVSLKGGGRNGWVED
jgi:hypothetical protein